MTRDELVANIAMTMNHVRQTMMTADRAKEIILKAVDEYAAAILYKARHTPTVVETNSDTDASVVARALHRTIRAFHDGECPSCHWIGASNTMRYDGPGIGEYGWCCPNCGFTITGKEGEAMIKAFAPYMEKNFAIYKKWHDEFYMKGGK